MVQVPTNSENLFLPDAGTLGLLPMALSTAVGAETSRPFAVVIIGGLVTATLVILFILPLLYPWFETENNAQSKNRAG